MITNDFTAAMSSEELQAGEARHHAAEQSRRLAMAAGLTKSSDDLSLAWAQDRGHYLLNLKAAVTAYNENKNIEELLITTIARLISVVDVEGDEVVEMAMEIVSASTDAQAS